MDLNKIFFFVFLGIFCNIKKTFLVFVLILMFVTAQTSGQETFIHVIGGSFLLSEGHPALSLKQTPHFFSFKV